jgi:hypothetical protein
VPLFAIHRKMDPTTTQYERELMVARSVGWADSALRPIWRRSFVIATEDRFESWCMYEGRTADELKWWNAECSVPFEAVWQVEQWRRDSSLNPDDGFPINWISGVLPSNRDHRAFEPLAIQPVTAGAVRVLRLYWDTENRTLYSAIAAPSIEAARSFALSAGLPHDKHELVDQVLPTDFADLYENLGFAPYNGDD